VRRLILLGTLVVAIALAWRTWSERPPARVPAPNYADSTDTGLRAVTLWFASASGDSLVAEVREMPERQGVHERLAASIAALEQGPRAGGVRVLPAGTELVHAFLDDNGLLTLDLSRPFRLGFTGGARSEELAIGSLVRTVAAQAPEARRIRILCAGAALSSLGGHFPLDQPLDPAEWP